MPDPEWLSSDVARALVDETVAAAVRQYRVDPGRAAETVRQSFAMNPSLRERVESGVPREEIARTRAFRDAATEAKRKIYYDLRRYRAATDAPTAAIERLATLAGHPPDEIDAVALEIAGTHASTRERLPDRTAFYRELLARVGPAATVLDVGCGLQPLLFPFADAEPPVRRYVAADKDPVSVAAVAGYARARPELGLTAVRWELREGWATLAARAGIARFDVALLFKVVAVVERQEAESVECLRTTPAGLWAVSGSRVALAKRRGIERRERACLTRFAESARRDVVAEFAVAEEFVWVLRERQAA